MKKTLFFIILIFSTILNANFVKIGIYGFENNTLLNKIAESYLSKKNNIIVVDREDIELIIQEKKLELLGIVENDENHKISKEANHEKSIFLFNNNFIFTN
ncbi:hypothetical protein JCM30566_05610 [Marinitoga arctica]